MNRRQKTFFKKKSRIYSSPLLKYFPFCHFTFSGLQRLETYLPAELCSSQSSWSRWKYLRFLEQTNHDLLLKNSVLPPPKYVYQHVTHNGKYLHENVPRFKHKFISLPFSYLFPFLFSLVFSPFSFLSFLFPILSYSFFLPFTFYVLSLVLSCLFPHLTCLCVLSFPFSLVSLVFSLFFSLVLSFLSFHFLVSFFISFFFLVPSVVCVLSFPLRFAVKPNFYFNLKMKL